MAVYGGLSLEEMVSRVALTIFDVYEERVGKELITKWVQEGAVIIDIRLNWSREQYPVDGGSSAGVYAYLLPSYARFVMSVTFDGAPLQRMEHEEWLQAYHRSSENGKPSSYAMWKGAIWLYPLPGDGGAINVYMVKAPKDLAKDADIPELPIELHDTIVRYALAQAYWHLQDIQAAESYEARVEKDILLFKGSVAEYRSGRDHMVDVDDV